MEWKRVLLLGRGLNGVALETSLVEWKLILSTNTKKRVWPLGNFLSGMETGATPPFRGRFDRLGNFLSGMETVFVPLLRFAPADLGNFLSGMETRPCSLKILSKESKYVKIVV